MQVSWLEFKHNRSNSKANVTDTVFGPELVNKINSPTCRELTVLIILPAVTFLLCSAALTATIY